MAYKKSYNYNSIEPQKSTTKSSSRLSVAVFDSGLGSLSVVKSIMNKAKPRKDGLAHTKQKQDQNTIKLDLIYLADQKSFPYGSKTIRQLTKTTKSSIAFLRNHLCADLIVVGSNTPSLMIKNMEEKLGVIGVFPPLENAINYLVKKAKKNNTNYLDKPKHEPYCSIAILATQAAVKGNSINCYIKDTLKEMQMNATIDKDESMRINLASKKQKTNDHSSKKNTSTPQPHIKIIKINASLLVELVESGKFLDDKNSCKKTIQNQLGQMFKEYNVKAATLSSTHLPFLLPLLEKIFPDVKFFDAADSVAKRVMDKVTTTHFTHPKKPACKNIRVLLSVYTTAGAKQRLALESNLRRLGIRYKPKPVVIPQKTTSSSS